MTSHDAKYVSKLRRFYLLSMRSFLVDVMAATIGEKSKQVQMNGNNGNGLQKTYQHVCITCDKVFHNGSNLNRHLRKVHKSVISRPPDNTRMRCCLCNADCISSKARLEHLQTEHGVQLIEETHTFSTDNEFKCWKRKVESETCSSYVKNNGSKMTDTVEIVYYRCHRSGSFSKIRKRRPRLQVSQKINGVCPARMKAVMHANDGIVEVHFQKTHVGHETEHLPSASKADEQVFPVSMVKHEEGRSLSSPLRNGIHCSEAAEEIVQTVKCEPTIDKRSLDIAKERLRVLVGNVNDAMESCETVEECDLMSQLLSHVTDVFDAFQRLRQPLQQPQQERVIEQSEETEPSERFYVTSEGEQVMFRLVH